MHFPLKSAIDLAATSRLLPCQAHPPNMAASAVRSFLRSSSLRSAARVARAVPSEARASRPPPCIHKARSDSPRIIRSLAMLGCCVDSFLPMHNATAAALMTSMLSVSMKGYGWLSEGKDDI